MSRILIGLTGGIATGKTTVANYLAKAYHLPVLDADLYARNSVQPGSPIQKAVCDRYGEAVQSSDGKLNRQKLGDIIFSSPVERQWLEAQIHPDVRQQFYLAIERLTEPIAVLVVPLLFEAKMTDLATQIWVVFCSPKQQLERLMQRDRLSLSQAQSRLDSQLPISQKIAAADVALDNSATSDYLYQQIDRATIDRLK